MQKLLFRRESNYGYLKVKINSEYEKIKIRYLDILFL